MRRASLVIAVLTAGVGCRAPSTEEQAPAASAPSHPAAGRAAPMAHADPIVAARLDDLARVTVRIDALQGDTVVAHGSGVLVSKTGRIRTAAHVVDAADARFVATLPSGAKAGLTHIVRDAGRDLAEADLEVAAEAWVETATPAGVGARIACGGFPGELSDGVPTRSLGEVRATDHVFEPKRVASGGSWRGPPTYESAGSFRGMLDVSCAIASGMSGGPVLDVDGRLVGVIVGVGVASPVDATGSVAPRRSQKPIADAAPASVGPAAQPTPDPAATTRDALIWLRAPRRQSLVGIVVGAGGLVLTAREAVRDPARSDEPTDDDVVTERERVARGDIQVVGTSDVACRDLVAVSGALALLRCAGVDVRPLARAWSTPVLGAEIRTLFPSPTGDLTAGAPAHDGLGFVTGLGRRPGTVTPPALQLGCGTLRARHRETHPSVHTGEVFAHDARRYGPGALVVDAAGAPLGVDVASLGSGIDFAVSWEDVLRRFPRIASAD